MTNAPAATSASTTPYATRTLTVIATMHEDIDPEQIYDEDLYAVGEHEFDVPAHLCDSDAAACALGIYHSLAAIKYLWHFEFVIVDEECNEVEPNYDAEIYDLANSCKELWVHLKRYYAFWED